MVKSILITIVLVCIVPVLLSVPFRNIGSPAQSNLNENAIISTTVPRDVQSSQQEENYLTVMTDEGVVRMQVENYLIGVVLAEMPAEFDIEALKAQAVVARTYTHKRMQSPKHTSSDICTNPACCQAYMDVKTYMKNGGSDAAVSKIEKAVSMTESEVLYYDDQLIEATYFSCSGGRTEDAAEVWGGDVPYLQSVDSPGEENATHYTDTVRFNKSDFCSLLDIPLSATVSVSEIKYTQGGGVLQLTVDGYTFSGTQIRSLLGLRSTAFVISIAGDSVTVTTKGFGHRVGMSQYGAEAMAVSGYSYEEILTHYYSGVEIGYIDC